MTRNIRQFCASISVRFDTRRTKIELSPAHLHGGPDGFFRVRVSRKWLDAPANADGGPLFFNQTGLAQLAAQLAFGGEAEPAPLPDMPVKSRVSVLVNDEEGQHPEGGWTVTPCIRAFDGRLYVGVSLYERGVVHVAMDDVTIHNKK